MCECATHTPLLHSTAEKLAVISLFGFVTAMTSFYIMHEAASLFFCQPGTQKRGKNNMNWKISIETAAATWHQTHFVFTWPLSLSVSVTCSMSSLPVSIPMTLLLTQDCDTLFIWAHFSLWILTTTDCNHARAGLLVWSPLPEKKAIWKSPVGKTPQNKLTCSANSC